MSGRFNAGDEQYQLLAQGLGCILLGEFDHGIEYLRKTPQIAVCMRRPPARGLPTDLEEPFEIATDGEMKRHLADYHIAMARTRQSRDDLEMAEELVAATGYHRRDAELAELRAGSFVRIVS